MKKVITSFTTHRVGEGPVISYTYSELDDLGNRLKSNARSEFVVVDKAIEEKIEDINNFIKERESATV